MTFIGLSAKKALTMRKVHNIKYGLLLAVLFCCFCLASERKQAGSAAESEQEEALYSSSISRKFYDIAYDLADADNATYIENEQAIVFLLAAMNLDGNNSDVRSLLLKCSCRFPEKRSQQLSSQGRTSFDLVYTLLRQYVDENADIAVVSDASAFLLNRASSTVQKQVLLEQMLKMFANKSPFYKSELETMYGLMKVQDNSLEEAEKYFRQAYQNNKNNKFAFSKLFELNPQKISPQEYLERLRLDFLENPIDIRTVLAFCQGLERMQLYDTAADAYEYCSDLFAYLHPSEPLPADIFIPWSISCYNSQKKQYKCLEIAEIVRKTGKFDIRLESLAGRAAGKLGEDQAASRIIRDAEKKALELISKESPDIMEAHLAWFYNFVIPMPDKAVEWSNRAFAADSNSPAAASLLAYSLTQKKEFITAKSLIEHFGANQISELALACIQLEEGQAAQGIENLNKAISHDPGSFEAERAKSILAQKGQKYVPPVNPDYVLASLEKNFGGKLVPVFTQPEKRFSIVFNIRNKELSFGDDLDCAISIINNSSEPLIISDDSMFKGNLRVDAIVSGDLNKRIPNLVSKRIKTAEAIEPGRSKIVGLKLITGELREMLMTYPQASLKITFVLHLDPVKSSEDRVISGLPYMKPVSVNVVRSNIVLTGQQIRNLVDSISASQSGQKIQSAQLFVGLLKEQHALSGRTSPYHIVVTDGMKTMLKSALIYDTGLLRNPENGGWAVKVYTMAEMLSLPLDYEFIEVISENLYNEKWPVRMMAVYLLAETQGEKFEKALENISKTDKNQLVRDIAGVELMKIRSLQVK
ncbi:MAG: hypothetical protein JW787_16710 [Sedimentisphaerales bacterium]|nr:hypothetical protein [Sedimentisphaerales bacterium]